MVPAEKSQDYSAYESRLHSELTAAGYAAATVQIPSSADPTTVAVNAERFSSPIAVSITISRAMVSGFVWIADLQKGGGTLRPVPEYPIGEEAPSVFAVKATDVLHGLLLELGYRANRPVLHESEASPDATAANQTIPLQSVAPQPERVVKPSSNQAREVPNPAISVRKENSNTWQITAATSVMQRWPLYSPNLGGKLGVLRRWGPWGLGVEGFGFVPNTLTSGSSQAQVRQFLAGATVQFYQPITPAFSILESAGSGLYGVYVSGEDAVAPKNKQPHLLIGYSSVGLGITWMPAAKVGLTMRTILLVPWALVDVRIGSEVAPRVVAPTALGELGVQLAF